MQIVIVTLAIALGALHSAPAFAAALACRSGDFALSDAKAIAGVRGLVARACPCADFDASAPDKKHGRFVKCARAVIDDATDGTPAAGVFTLRRECRSAVRAIYSKAACGYSPSRPRVMCCEANGTRTKAAARKVASCVDHGQVLRHACYTSPFGPDACSFDATNRCTTSSHWETVDIPSPAEPADTPGTPGVVVTNPKLLTQFGPTFSLNNARYTVTISPARRSSRTRS
jgi:hypothetical protein